MPLPFIGPALSFLGGGSAAAKGLGTALTLAGTAKGIVDANKAPGPSQQSYGQLMGAFRAADEAGLHRLAVAGSPSGYSPVPSAAADGLLAAGDVLRTNSKKQDELIDAQIEEARSRTILNNANTRRALMGPQPGLGGPSTRLMDALERLSTTPNSAGGPRALETLPEEDAPLLDTTVAPDGTRMRNVRNPVDLSELIGSALWYGPQYVTGKIRELGEYARRNAPPEDRRGEARRRASDREQRAQRSDYLFPRR